MNEKNELLFEVETLLEYYYFFFVSVGKRKAIGGIVAIAHGIARICNNHKLWQPFKDGMGREIHSHTHGPEKEKKRRRRRLKKMRMKKKTVKHGEYLCS